MRNKKILVLGAKGFPAVTCYDWGDKDLPNIPDYDIVILNVVSFTKNLSFINVGTLQSIGSDLLKVLDFDGKLYAIACPFKEEIIKTKITGQIIEYSIDNYMWSPIPLEINNEEQGVTLVKIEDESFKDYFKHGKEWYFTVKPEIKTAPAQAFEDYDQNLIRAYIGTSNVIMVKIATDRRRRAIAAKFYYEHKIIRKPTASEHDESAIALKSGDFILLPLPTEINDIEAINFVLEKCLGVVQRTPPPVWAKKISVPKLNEIESEFETIESEINRLSKEKNELKEQEAELASYKELLYETGHPLEEIVRKVFTELGYPPKPPRLKEEYIIEFNNKIGIIECKGVTKSINRDHFRQLLERIVEYETRFNINAKGILIANAWRDFTPEKRDTQEKPIFPAGEDGVIDIAERYHIALVNTIDLFNIFCKYKQGKIKPKKILETIFNADGIFKFPL